MIAGIYCIKSKQNGRVYIGKAANAPRRWCEHIRDLENNKHSCKPLQADYNNFGLENFTFEILEVVNKNADVIEVFGSEDILLEKESYWGLKLEADKKLTGYNYISKFSRKIKDVGSVTILNSIRRKILQELTKEHLAIYMIVVANYDIQLGFSTIYDKTLADELNISKSKAKSLIVQLKKIGVIDYFQSEDFQNYWCYSLTKEETELQKDIYHFYTWNKIKNENVEMDELHLLEENLISQLTMQELNKLNDYLKKEIQKLKEENILLKNNQKIKISEQLFNDDDDIF